jgi:hypothetical protein
LAWCEGRKLERVHVHCAAGKKEKERRWRRGKERRGEEGEERRGEEKRGID